MALFDMDRTLVQRNTAQLFTRYRRDRGEVGLAYSARVAWWLALYTAGLADVSGITRRALREFKGLPVERYRRDCRDWFPEYAQPLVQGREVVEGHREKGDLIVVVTGSARYPAEPLLEHLSIEHLVCSELGVDDAGCLDGEFVEPLCFGQGKVERTRRFLDEHGFGFEDCTCYTDSITDAPLLEVVGRAVAVNPDLRLRRLAQSRGWEIQSWRPEDRSA